MEGTACEALLFVYPKYNLLSKEKSSTPAGCTCKELYFQDDKTNPWQAIFESWLCKNASNPKKYVHSIERSKDMHTSVAGNRKLNPLKRKYWSTYYTHITTNKIGFLKCNRKREFTRTYRFPIVLRDTSPSICPIITMNPK